MFSKRGTYPPAGLYTFWHIIAIIICFVLLAILVFLTRNMKKKAYYTMLKVLSISVSMLELFKIIWSIVVDGEPLKYCFTLYFCSLFIYALWFSWFSNERIRALGVSFLAYGGVVAGLVFIICPTTSFLIYPIFHFKCLYSLLFHFLFAYSGIMAYFAGAIKCNITSAIRYTIFALIFMLIAVICNTTLGTNMMFFAEPSIIPFPVLHEIWETSQTLYTITMIIAHLSIAWLLLLIVKIVEVGCRKNRLIRDN